MKRIVVLAAVLVSSLSFMSFTNNGMESLVDHRSIGDNTCIVHVMTSSGADARSVKVSTDVSGSMACVGGRSFYTDSDGLVELRWSSGCNLKNVFVKGKGYKVNYKNGGRYSITMR